MTPKHVSMTIPQVPEELKKSSLLEQPSQENLMSAKSDLIGSLIKETLVEETTAAGRIEFIAVEDSWSEIKDAQGNIILSQILKKGEKFTLPPISKEQVGDYVLSTGNAGGLTVAIDGQRMGRLGKPTEVKRDIVLNVQTLQKILENTM